MNIGIVGTGLIGGSIARDLQERGDVIRGYDSNPIHAEKAIDLNVVNEICSLPELAAQSDLIVVSVPVSIAPQVVLELLELIKWNTTVIDTGSTKGSVCEAVANHKKRGRFVACHPLAGTEFSGPTAAIKDLYRGKKNIICEEDRSDPDALEQVIELFRHLGMTNLFMNPAEHDKHMAYVSHLSHVSAFMLGTTVLDIEQDEKQIFNLASTGFESTVRLAKSSPETWSNIFADNQQNVTEALDAYIKHLKTFRQAIVDQDTEAMKEMIKKSNEIRRILDGMKYNVVKLS